VYKPGTKEGPNFRKHVSVSLVAADTTKPAATRKSPAAPSPDNKPRKAAKAKASSWAGAAAAAPAAAAEEPAVTIVYATAPPFAPPGVEPAFVGQPVSLLIIPASLNPVYDDHPFACALRAADEQTTSHMLATRPELANAFVQRQTPGSIFAVTVGAPPDSNHAVCVASTHRARRRLQAAACSSGRRCTRRSRSTRRRAAAPRPPSASRSGCWRPGRASTWRRARRESSPHPPGPRPSLRARG
jgi:hypothetical protein